MTRLHCIASLLSLAVTSLALLGAAPVRAQAQAQDYPNRPIRVIVPFPPGSGPDVDTRGVMAELSKVLGQSVSVENRPGASGAIGTSAAAKATPDGYTLIVGTPGTLFLTPRLSANAPYDVDRDLAPISMMGYLNYALLAYGALPQANLVEVIAQARRLPGSFNVAALGVGSGAHVAGEWFAGAAGVTFNFIPYSTTNPFSDLMGGQVQLLFDALPASIGNVRAGKLKLLALTGTTRHPSFPDVPTFAEAGVADFSPMAFISLLAPTGTPKAVVDTLAAGLQKAVTMNPALVDKWRGNGGELKAMTPEEFGAFLKTESAKWAAVIRRNNIRID